MSFESIGQKSEKVPDAWSTEDQAVFERLASDPALVEELKTELKRFDEGLENDRKGFLERAGQGDATSLALLEKHEQQMSFQRASLIRKYEKSAGETFARGQALLEKNKDREAE